MKNIKQQLIDEIVAKLKEIEQEIKSSDDELKILEAKLKVENQFSKMNDLKEDLKEDVKYSVIALEGMLVMESNRNAELKKDFEILRFRKQVINKFEDGEL